MDRGYAYPFSLQSSPFSHPFSHFSHLASPFSLPSVFSPLFSFLPPLFSFLPPLFSFLPPRFTFLPSLFFLLLLLLSLAPSLLSPGLPIHCPSSHNKYTDRTKKNNIQAHSATSYLIFQYLQHWYNQYFPEFSSICNTGITSIFQNLPVSAILV